MTEVLENPDMFGIKVTELRGQCTNCCVTGFSRLVASILVVLGL